MWSACSPAPDGNASGTDGTYVLMCRDGRWEPVMTVDEYLRTLRGEHVTIAPLPTPPTSSTTTTSTTTSTSTTSTTSTTTTSTTTTSTTTSVPAATVDVEHVPSANGAYDTNYCDELDPGNTRTIAQSFLAGRTGELTQVDLAASPAGDPPPIAISIRPIDGGVPGTTVLGSGTYDGPGSSSTPVAITLTTPAPVTAGTEYAVVVDPVLCSEDFWNVSGNTTTPYADGTAFTSHDGVTWSADNADVLFRTWVR
jgi:hypothetical protein